jgi:hypothetical protein
MNPECYACASSGSCSLRKCKGRLGKSALTWISAFDGRQAIPSKSPSLAPAINCRHSSRVNSSNGPSGLLVLPITTSSPCLATLIHWPPSQRLETYQSRPSEKDIYRATNTLSKYLQSGNYAEQSLTGSVSFLHLGDELHRLPRAQCGVAQIVDGFPIARDIILAFMILIAREALDKCYRR